MKLSRLYSNQPRFFRPIDFSPGLNAVVGEIRLPENQGKDTHNLGKTTLGRLLDFCLLGGRDKGMFLFKHIELFGEFVFFLELRLRDGSFLTIRRGVSEHTKISFKRHMAGNQDYSALADDQWDHVRVPFEASRNILDGMLDLTALKPWGYRKGIGYQLRSQSDYQDVFQLRKFAAAHSDWKPYIAHILGFDDDLVTQHYAKEAEIQELQSTVSTMQAELGTSAGDLGTVEGLLLLKQKDVSRKQTLLNDFDFRREDIEKTRQLVEDIDRRIASLNNDRYYFSHNLNKIERALENEQVLFSTDDARTLFGEAGIVFDGQIKREFDELISFNRAITAERRAYLDEERTNLETRLNETNSELSELGEQRAQNLSFLGGTDVIQKYRRASDELVSLRADVLALERQRSYLQRLQALRAQVRESSEELRGLAGQLEANVDLENANPDGTFSQIRLHFNDIVKEVIDRSALLTVSLNNKDHLEFRAEILDEAGNTTSAERGHTYKKLLCVAFDLAVMRTYLGSAYPEFVYHDGVFESLDDRKKVQLLSVMREYAGLGIQQVITLIDSDMPPPPGLNQQEIVLTLHDQGDDGRLFMMSAW